MIASALTRGHLPSGRRRPGTSGRGVGFSRWLVRHARSIILAGLMAALATAYLGGWMSETASRLARAFDSGAREAGLVVRRFEVEGTSRIDRATLIAALDIEKGTPLLDVDIERARANIEALSWVRSAAITRRFPETLAVTVKERLPFALWQIEGRVWLIDREGERITDSGLAGFSDLPYLVGAGAPAAAETFFSLLSSEPDLMRRVSVVIRVGERRWDVEFDNGARLRLPEAAADYGPRTAWNRFAVLERDHSLLAREVAIFDMRLADRLVMQSTPEGLEKLARTEQGT